MTSQEFAEGMRLIFSDAAYTTETGHVDRESQHLDADNLMTEVLCDLGFEEGIGVFLKADKWYS